MKSLVFIAFLAVSVLAAPDQKFECLRKIIGTENSLSQSRGAYEIRNILTMYTALSQEMQTAVQACNLNLKPAMERCERSYGVGNCEQVTPSAIQVKCDSRFKRVGIAHCAQHCPQFWTENEYHCTKPASTQSVVYSSITSCPGGQCEMIGGSFVSLCAGGQKRVGLNQCVAVCPLGWHDEGARCRKPANYRLTQPFLWTLGDN